MAKATSIVEMERLLGASGKTTVLSRSIDSISFLELPLGLQNHGHRLVDFREQQCPQDGSDHRANQQYIEVVHWLVSEHPVGKLGHEGNGWVESSSSGIPYLVNLLTLCR